MQLASCLDRGPLMWIRPLLLHDVNIKPLVVVVVVVGIITREGAILPNVNLQCQGKAYHLQDS